MPSSTTCSRCPSGSIASTNGWLRSIRRPLRLEHPLDQLLHLGAASGPGWSARAGRAGRRTPGDGSLIQISSTAGSSRNGCSGPNPDTRATSSPTTASASGTGATTPVRLRSSWSRTTASAIRRTTPASACGSTPSRRTTSRTCASSRSTSSSRAVAGAPACVVVIQTPDSREGVLLEATVSPSLADREEAGRNLWMNWYVGEGRQLE